MKCTTLLLALALTLTACGDDASPVDETPENGSETELSTLPGDPAYLPRAKGPGWKTPEYIEVKHILISFDDAAGASKLTKKRSRSQAEAEALAKKLVDRIRGGEDIEVLRRAYSQDSEPSGIYRLQNSPRRTTQKIQPRSGMVKYFGDVAFSLDVGETAVAYYHEAACPYGYHVIQRLK